MLVLVITWEQRKLGDITLELEEYTTLQSKLPLLTSSRNGLIFQNEYREIKSTDNQNTLFSIVPRNACTYRHMSDDDIFHFNINTLADKGLVSREYPVFIANKNNNLGLIVYYLNSSPRFRKFCKQQKLGGTRTRLYYKKLANFLLKLPRYNEQEKIATFLLGIDNLITLHQRKLNTLKRIVVTID